MNLFANLTRGTAAIEMIGNSEVNSEVLRRTVTSE